MVAMKSGEVVLSLAAQLASWRAVLVLVRPWATCKPWQRKGFHQYSIFVADCLKQSQQAVWESASGASESWKVGKGRRKRRFADVDRPGANSEPKLGPRGPTLKKQALKGFDGLDLPLGLRPADSVDTTQDFDTQDFEWERETSARDEDSSSGVSSVEESSSSGESYDMTGSVSFYFWDNYNLVGNKFWEDDGQICEAMDPAGSPSSIRKVADTTSPSSSAAAVAPDPGWRYWFCLGNGK